MNDLLDSDTPLLTFPSGHWSHLLTKLIKNGKTKLMPSLILPIILGKVLPFHSSFPLPHVPADASEWEKVNSSR